MSEVVYRRAAAAAALEARYAEVLAQWPVPSTQMGIETRQGRTFVLACGPEDGPPVVLLHGAQANSAAWLPDITRWSTRFRLYAVDMIGEAGLSAPVRPDLGTDAHALWLDDVLSGLNVSRPAFVGTSLGGWLALDYASRRHGAVHALGLICPAGIGRQKNFALKAIPLLLLGPWGRRKMWELVFGPAPDVLPQAMQPIAALMEDTGKATKPRFVTIPQLTDEQLRALDMPVLAIVGGRDALLDSFDTRNRLQRNTPRAEVCFIDDGYHFLPDLTECVMEFLERVTSPEASANSHSIDQDQGARR
jgi:pimeloyl-ACP methyl ester carboxylesterase